MLTKEKILSFLKKNSKNLRDNYHISQIGLFGSYARDEQNIKSDIDFIIEFDGKVDDVFETKLRLKQFLISNFNRDINICRKKYLKPMAKEFILQETIYA